MPHEPHQLVNGEHELSDRKLGLICENGTAHVLSWTLVHHPSLNGMSHQILRWLLNLFFHTMCPACSTGIISACFRPSKSLLGVSLQCNEVGVVCKIMSSRQSLPCFTLLSRSISASLSWETPSSKVYLPLNTGKILLHLPSALEKSGALWVVLRHTFHQLQSFLRTVLRALRRDSRFTNKTSNFKKLDTPLRSH